MVETALLQLKSVFLRTPLNIIKDLNTVIPLALESAQDEIVTSRAKMNFLNPLAKFDIDPKKGGNVCV